MCIPRAAVRAFETQQDVRRCPDADLGCDGKAECVQSNSGCAGTSDEDDESAGKTATTPDGDTSRRMLRHDQKALPLDIANHSTAVGCRPGLMGTYCKLCAPHAERVFYYPATRTRAASCRICYNMAVYHIMSAMAVAAGVALGALVLWCAHSRLSEMRQRQFAYAWRKCT